jgi:CRP-like cAMP-binding protein
MPTSQTVSLLRELPFAKAVGEACLGRLLANSLVQILPPGAVLFEEGAIPDATHVVLSGRVGLVASGGTDQETVIEIFGPGTFLLVPAVVLGLPYLASAVVMAEARVMAIRADAFRAELDSDCRFARAVVDMLARHWRLLIEQIKDLKLRGATERLADWILRASEGGATETVTLAETKRVLARRLGMSPESFSRAVAALAERGAIRLSGRVVRVLDPAALAQAAGRPVPQAGAAADRHAHAARQR